MVGNRVLRVGAGAGDAMRVAITAICEELHLSPDFPPAVEQAAAAAAKAPRLPDRDLTDLPFVTIDPEGAMDLDQAMHLARNGDGFTVHYAIADVAAFVTAGDPVDVESQQRGESMYGADSKIPLHPKALSEDAASLLPDQVRPAFVWTIELDKTGAQTSATVERARVKSTAKLDYVACQKAIDDGSAEEWLQVLAEIGKLRQAIEAQRGGINLPMPEQEIDIQGEGDSAVWSLVYRAVLPVEDWNAQISLLTGFAAAQIMLQGKVGILRTMPEPDAGAVEKLRRTAKALKVEWPAEQQYPEFIRSLDSSVPNQSAMILACTLLLRGAGYTAFNGEVPELTVQSALAAEYAHTTAPLRRLVDRYVLEACTALCAGQPVPEWVTATLPKLPEIMQESGRKAHTYENAVINLVEAAVLKPHVGEKFTGVVVELDQEAKDKGSFTIQEPAVEATITGADLPLGDEVTATLAEADTAKRTVTFTL